MIEGTAHKKPNELARPVSNLSKGRAILAKQDPKKRNEPKTGAQRRKPFDFSGLWSHDSFYKTKPNPSFSIKNLASSDKTNPKWIAKLSPNNYIYSESSMSPMYAFNIRCVFTKQSHFINLETNIALF
jgi:hypothetical protein